MNKFQRKAGYIDKRYYNSTDKHKARMLLILCNEKEDNNLCPFCGSD